MELQKICYCPQSPQTDLMKAEIMEQLTSNNSTIKVVFATVVMGLGVNMPSIRQVVHIGPAHTVRISPRDWENK